MADSICSFFMLQLMVMGLLWKIFCTNISKFRNKILILYEQITWYKYTFIFQTWFTNWVLNFCILWTWNRNKRTELLKIQWQALIINLIEMINNFLLHYLKNKHHPWQKLFFSTIDYNYLIVSTLWHIIHLHISVVKFISH